MTSPTACSQPQPAGLSVPAPALSAAAAVDEVHAFSRRAPSPRYLELLDLNRQMHQRGWESGGLSAAETFSGGSLPAHAATIQKIISVLDSRTVLDYGSGKGAQYGRYAYTSPEGREFPDIGTYWGVESITCYDPAYAPFDRLPTGRFDGVVSTDVLEHCPAEDIPWIVNEMFSFATEFVYLNVACYSARKTLPNGENAHCTVEEPAWWKDHFDGALATRPGLRYFAVFDVPRADGTGLEREIIQGKMKLPTA